MNRFLLFLLSFSLFINISYSQIPVINYTTPQKFTVGVPLSPVLPVNTGGSVPNLIYTQTSTIAGNGYYGNRDTLAALSMFENPTSVTYDPAGNLYVADANLNQIRKISTAGIVSVFAGSANGIAGRLNGKDTAARFNYPTGLASDASGNIYVADCVNNLIRKILPDGTVTTFAGNINPGSNDGLGSAAQFTAPYGIGFDLNGNLLVADTYSNKIRKITPGGLVTTIAGSGASSLANGPGTTASFNTPNAVAVDNSGNIYVSDQGNQCIRKINTSGVVSTFSTGIYNFPVSVAVDKLNRVYVSCQNIYHIIQIDPTGNVITTNYPYFSGGDLKRSSNGTDTLTKYVGGMGLTFDGHDNLLIADPGSSFIRKVAVSGYTIYPRLPPGLSIDGTGAITGTPTSLLSATNYTITAYNTAGAGSATVNISIGVGSQTITFNPITTQTYGASDFPPGAMSSDTIVPITYTSSDTTVAKILKGQIHIVGTGSTTITANQAPNANYTAAVPVSQVLTVNKAVLSVLAINITKTGGTANPVFTVGYQGFVNKEDTTVLLTKPVAQTTATTSSAAGNYPITVSGATATNYTFNYVPGTLTVFPIPTIAAAGSTTIAKGDSVLLSASPATGYTYQWQFNGTNITGAISSTYAAKQTGVYTVSITSNSYTTYSLVTAVTVQLQLPANNFTLQLNSVTCKGSNNGSVHLSAVQKLNYTATFSGNNINTSYNFTDTLSINNLSPGNYSVCISVNGEIFNQCYQVNITEPKDLSVYSTINKNSNTLNLQLNGGSTFNIVLNNVAYYTSKTEITLPLIAGINKLTVTTDKICQGYIEKIIDAADNLTPYPNPFQNILNVNVGNSIVNNVQVNIVNLSDGKSVYRNQYLNQSGVLQFDLSALKNGLYFINLNLDNNKSGYKLIKK